ncbi:MAG TPA: hypothetical protein VFY23_04370 [Candidatus Limnocylindrales bacterium]|nr:hypothetical protein [Candidatus Limnocylindrales bacterium]
MDDERWEPGMPVLDRQAVPERAPAGPTAAGGTTAAAGRSTSGATAPALPIRPGEEHLPPSLRGLPPRSVPETKPTPLEKHYVLLSAPAMVLGAIAITALNLGAGFDSLIVKLCVLLAAPLLLVTTADATLRIWRSAWAWMPVNRGRGLFRLAWVGVSLVFLALIVLALVLVLGA